MTHETAQAAARAEKAAHTGSGPVESHKIYSELFGLICFFWALFLLLSLITYDGADPSFNVVNPGRAVKNGAGLVGAYLGGILVDFFGVGAFAFVLVFAVVGLKKFIRLLAIAWWRWVGFCLLCFCLMTMASSPWAMEHVALGAVNGGGFFGRSLFQVGYYYLQPSGALLVWLFVFLTAIQLLGGMTWNDVAKRCKGYALDLWLKHKERILRKHKVKQLRKEPVEIIEPHGDPASRQTDATPTLELRNFFRLPASEAPENAGIPVSPGAPIELDNPIESDEDFLLEEETAPPVSLAPDEVIESDDTGSTRSDEAPIEVFEAQRAAPRKRPIKSVSNLFRKLTMPTTDLLAPIVVTANKPSLDALQAKADKLKGCLADFGVLGDVQRICPGPVVTMFEYKPAPGIKISRIANLSDDLSLALKALAIRIEAPIPGKDTVGIEVPSDVRETVYLRELLEDPSFRQAKSVLTMALGKDIGGQPQVADLARMPHLLVAGATGAGKSVCLNAILLSFLYKAKPEDLKLLLVDPKRIELSVYDDLPHLVHPVVTDMSQAKNALEWAVHEMDNRYEAMARVGARNIESYNQKLALMQEKVDHVVPDELIGLERMPFLVIIIDELADLMLTGAKEVEMSIVRLAQLARAAGIHMILATQRPSVDVVTGLIKANFPCRISFQVTSKHDARTILDQVGSEHLLGKGDMLFKPGGGKLQRMHAPFVSDDDVNVVVDFWKSMQKPSYLLDFSEWQGSGEASEGTTGQAGGLDNDSIYREAVAFVASQGKASISLLQRRFRIGFNRSARYIEQMEVDGFIGPADGSKPRMVLKGE